MKHLLRYIVGLMLMLTATAAAQEQDAFYVYQNDGHFDGFFYDEVEKIRYSKTDTLGFEHEVFVSQEIVTADSTYRFMLTAIDSIGFHQPEIIYNPRLRVLVGDDNQFEERWTINRNLEDNTAWILHNEDWIPELPKELYPQPGDVFANFDLEYGWSAKVVSVREETVDGAHYVVAQLKPVDDITDIFQQYVTVEKYSHDGEGNLLSRRVAGHPELTVDHARTRAYDDFDYNLLNFSISGHIPIYNENDKTVSLDASIGGKIDLRVAYDLSFWGTKYIGITTNVETDLSLGVSVDGKLSEKMLGGLSKVAQIPLPTPTPILMLVLCPDGFVRAEGHFHASLTSPKASGKFWVKLEIRDWVPSMDWGRGSSSKDEKEKPKDENGFAASIELNGFVQAGTAFPLGFASLPIIKDLFDASIDGTWYVGPKFSGAFNINLMNIIFGDNDAYTNLKDTKVSLSLMDFDFQMTAKVSSLFSSKKEWTLLDGTYSMWPTIDLQFFPDFEDCEKYDDVGIVDDTTVTYDCYAFNPEGNVFLPQTVGVGLYYIDENGKEKFMEYQPRSTKYYQIENKTFESVYEWPALKVWAGSLESLVTNIEEDYKTRKFRVRPMIDLTHLFGGGGENGPTGLIKATPVYDFEVEKLYKTSCDTIFVNYDGTIARPVRITGPLDGITPYVPHYGEERFPEWVVVSGGKGNVEVSIDQEKFQAAFPKNYSMVDTLWIDEWYNSVTKEVNADYRLPVQFGCYARFGTNTVTTDGEHGLYVAVLPNVPDVCEDPVSFGVAGSVHVDGGWGDISFTSFLKDYRIPNPTCTVRREGNVWHCSYDASRSINGDNWYSSSESLTATFDIESMEGRRYKVKNGNIYYNNSWKEQDDGREISSYKKLLWTFGDIIYTYSLTEGGVISAYSSTQTTGGSGNYTATVKNRDNPIKTKKGNGIPEIAAFFQDYINNHPEEFQ